MPKKPKPPSKKMRSSIKDARAGLKKDEPKTIKKGGRLIPPKRKK